MGANNLSPKGKMEGSEGWNAGQSGICQISGINKVYEELQLIVADGKYVWHLELFGEMVG